MIKGLGIEIVDVERFKKALKRWGLPLSRRLFTEDELKYCLGKRSPAPHLAARFAAKISFFKAMGRSMPYQSLGVVRDENGRPSIRLNEEKGGRLKTSLTISHTRETAMAVVLVENES